MEAPETSLALSKIGTVLRTTVLRTTVLRTTRTMCGIPHIVPGPLKFKAAVDILY